MLRQIYGEILPWKEAVLHGSALKWQDIVTDRKYRCVVTDAEGNTAVSGTAVITVAEPEAPVITGQPEDYTGSVG